MHSCNFVIISRSKKVRLFHLKTEILFTEGCFLQNLVEIGPVVLYNKIFKFSVFYNYLPLEECGALHLNKLLPKDALC